MRGLWVGEVFVWWMFIWGFVVARLTVVLNCAPFGVAALMGVGLVMWVCLFASFVGLLRFRGLR